MPRQKNKKPEPYWMTGKEEKGIKESDYIGTDLLKGLSGKVEELTNLPIKETLAKGLEYGSAMFLPAASLRGLLKKYGKEGAKEIGEQLLKQGIRDRDKSATKAAYSIFEEVGDKAKADDVKRVLGVVHDVKPSEFKKAIKSEVKDVKFPKIKEEYAPNTEQLKASRLRKKVKSFEE